MSKENATEILNYLLEHKIEFCFVNGYGLVDREKCNEIINK